MSHTFQPLQTQFSLEDASFQAKTCHVWKHPVAKLVHAQQSYQGPIQTRTKAQLSRDKWVSGECSASSAACSNCCQTFFCYTTTLFPNFIWVHFIYLKGWHVSFLWEELSQFQWICPICQDHFDFYCACDLCCCDLQVLQVYLLFPQANREKGELDQWPLFWDRMELHTACKTHVLKSSP